MKKVFITGGNGVLGSKLIEKISSYFTVFAPNKEECDVRNLHSITTNVSTINPDVVIHLAAFVDTFGCESDKEKAIDINIIGTINMVKACLETKCKFVYLSSEYVFDGNKGNYTVDDKPDPINVYGKTKASSEYIVSILPNYQIIRAPFIRKVYPKVFNDQYCSRYFLDEVVEKIINNIINNDDKLIHISSERASLYETYIKKGIDVQPIKMTEEYLKIIPRDTSLINNSI